MAHIGVGGPGLTNAAFTAGVTNLTNTLQATNQATIDYHWDATVKTFANKHGPSQGQHILNLCNVADEAGLPKVHTALVNCPKSQEYAIIMALFTKRADTMDLPISLANAPLATTCLVDNVFCFYIPGGTGLTFGKGLSPFSIMCEGHKEAADAKTLAHNASFVESGTSTLLSDVKTITSNDVRFLMEVYVTLEKLCGRLVAVNVFHGINHPAQCRPDPNPGSGSGSSTPQNPSAPTSSQVE